MDQITKNGWQTTHINNILLELLAAIEQSINERKRERKKPKRKRVHIVSALVYLHDVIGSVNVIVSMKPGRHVDLPLSHATLSIPLVDHAYYRLPYHEPLEHFDRSMIGHSILSIRRLEFPHIENSICQFNCPIWEAKKRTIWEEILTLLPGLMWPSCSAIEPRLTFSTMAPKRLFDNNWRQSPLNLIYPRNRDSF